MTGSLDEAIDQQSPLGADLRAGYEALSEWQAVTFTKYVRIVLPLDGYVFWVRADKLGTSALLNASKFNTSRLDQQSIVTAAPFLNVLGSLHYSTDTEQGDEQVINTNRVVLTTAQPVDDFNQVNPSVLYVAEYDGIKFAFSSRGRLYKPQAGIYHYVGAALYSDMSIQLVDDPRTLDVENVVVSNSLPIWLSMNGYAAVFGGFGNNLTLYPSFLSPLNEVPPFATVHVVPGETRAIQASPLLDSDGSHWQLVRDLVRVTIYGTRNFSALTFQDFVNQFSLDTDQIGVMNLPIIRDEKREQSELMTIAQKKSIEFEVSYYQSTVRDVARQLITSALPVTLFIDGIFPNIGILVFEIGEFSYSTGTAVAQVITRIPVGALIVVSITSSDDVPPQIRDTAGNVYNGLSQVIPSPGNGAVSLFWAQSLVEIKAGGFIIVSGNGSVSANAFFATGVTQSDPGDDVVVISGVSRNPVFSSSASLRPGDLSVAVIGTNGATASLPAGWTNPPGNESSPNVVLMGGYRTGPDTGPRTYATDFAEPTPWAAMMFSFQAEVRTSPSLNFSDPMNSQYLPFV